MHIRKRASNLSLERAVYEKATVDAAGLVITPARRTTQYLGSVSAYARWAHVPRDLRDKLTPEEVAELQAALAGNEPRPDHSITALPGMLQRVGQELVAAAAQDRSPEGIARLKERWKELEAAWAQLQHDAQTAGLRRVVRRKPAPAAAPADKQE